MSVHPFLHQSETLASSQWNFSQAYCNHCRAAAQWLIMFIFKPPSTYMSTDPTNHPAISQPQTRSLLLTTKATLLRDWRAIGSMSSPLLCLVLLLIAFFWHSLSTAYFFFWSTSLLICTCSVIINTSRLDHTVTCQLHPLPSEREPDTYTPLCRDLFTCCLIVVVISAELRKQKRLSLQTGSLWKYRFFLKNKKKDCDLE